MKTTSPYRGNPQDGCKNGSKLQSEAQLKDRIIRHSTNNNILINKI